MSDDRGTSAGTVILAFLAGAAVGAAVALLVSPKSGPEMRDGLKELGDRLARSSGLKKDGEADADGGRETAPTVG